MTSVRVITAILNNSADYFSYFLRQITTLLSVMITDNKLKIMNICKNPQLVKRIDNGTTFQLK